MPNLLFTDSYSYNLLGYFDILEIRDKLTNDKPLKKLQII